MRPVQIWCDEFPVLSQTFVVNEARALRDLGHEVTIVAGRETAPQDEFAVRAHAPSLAAAARLAARHPVRALRDLLARRRWRRQETVRPLRELAPAVAALTPDTIVHAHFAAGAALDAMRAARLRRRPWSLTAHAYDIYLTPMNLREKLAHAAFATSGCDYTVADLRRIAPEATVHKVLMGVDPARFARTRPYDPAGPVLAVGRLVEKKGFLHLVRATPRRTIVVGDGPQRAALEAAANPHVEFAGARSPQEIRDLLERAAVLAAPCVVAADGDRDSMPVVVKEAMAMEVPVVASDAVGLPEIVRPPWGALVPAGDEDALRAALADPPADGAAGRAQVPDTLTEARRLSALWERA